MAKFKKCIAVKLKEFDRISPKCWKAIDFNGNTDLIPDSQVLGFVDSGSDTECVLITEWILQQKSLSYSTKNAYWVNPDTLEKKPAFTVEKHVPTPIKPIQNTIPDELIR